MRVYAYDGCGMELALFRIRAGDALCLVARTAATVGVSHRIADGTIVRHATPFMLVCGEPRVSLSWDPGTATRLLQAGANERGSVLAYRRAASFQGLRLDASGGYRWVEASSTVVVDR